MVEQGDVIKASGIDFPLLVLSKNIFNETGKAVVCPILKDNLQSTLKFYFSGKVVSGYVYCDNLRTIDVDARGGVVKDHISIKDILIILDMVQSVFDIY